jgi:hypothetical protein
MDLYFLNNKTHNTTADSTTKLTELPPFETQLN